MPNLLRTDTPQSMWPERATLSQTVASGEESAATHSGDAAPFSTHSRHFLANSSCDSGGFVRPSPGSHPHRTSLSCVTCSSSCSSVLPPFRLGSFSWSASSRGPLP